MVLWQDIHTYVYKRESTARMIRNKKLDRMAKKWQKITIMRKERISLPGTSNAKAIAGSVDESSVAEKGHFVIYTTDQMRHVVSLYLSNNIFVELLKLSEEEFGLSSHDPIKLPCDSALLEYIVFIVQQGLDKHLEKALLSSISPGRYSLCASFHQGQTGQHSFVCGY
ncbi:auxin-responsive protein SAUR61-like [Durio zibethinus]|uniref:Auxin-responsive protein SAUR61-like n=1 Tax=Durio zibethinus TaxID=66656 RepID=A0A6P5XE00_DURZI|nr:auxin-responsive protein SAUR61-like [Durio zibethinus]